MKAISPLRLALLLPVLALAVLPSCKRNTNARMDPKWWKLEAERVGRVQEVKLLKMRLEGDGKGEEYVALKEEQARNEAKLAELKATAAALRTDISGLTASLQQQYEAWVKTTRAAAIGRGFDTFTTGKGRSYENVVITKVTDVGIEFRHSTGTARLPAAEISQEMQAVFGLDSQIALAAMEQERAAASAYESWIDSRMSEVDAERKEALRIAADREADRKIELAKARSEALANTDLTDNRSRLRDEPRAFGSSRNYTTWYPDYGYSRNRYYYPVSYYRLNGSMRDYAKAFGVTIGGGCYGGRVTPVLPRTSNSTPSTPTYRPTYRPATPRQTTPTSPFSVP